MGKQVTRKCKYCQMILPGSLHGNFKYHPECLVYVKNMSNHARYGRIKNLCNDALTLDKILKQHYMHSQGVYPVKFEALEKDGFRIDFNSRITYKNNKIAIFWILEYGYSFTDRNQKNVIIYDTNT